MNSIKWLITTLFLTALFAVIMVAVNLIVDHHAVRQILFNGKLENKQTAYPDGINQRMFNAELIFSNPEKFESLLFGSSRVAVIDVAKISSERFYNMFYTTGQPPEHLAIIKAFLQKGIKPKSVVIGLDEFCFNPPDIASKKELLMVMHPDVNGPTRAEIFAMYFFRKPTRRELKTWYKRVVQHKKEGRYILSDRGVNLGWQEQKDKKIERTGKPIFDFKIRKYEPVSFDRQETDEAFKTISELIQLSRQYHFRIIFFFNPLYSEFYLNHAEAMFNIKERLTLLTDYYDFSGFTSVTTNALNYYEESHYRYRIGDMIIKQIFGSGDVQLPDDFGLLITRENVTQHIAKQKNDLEQYLKTRQLR